VEGSLTEIDDAFDVLGADEIVLQSSNYDGSYLGDTRFDPVLAELDRRAALVFVHPAIPRVAQVTPIPAFAMDFPFDTRAAFNLAYSGSLERLGDITWILSHAGGTVPYLVSRFSLLWAIDPQLADRAPDGANAYLARLYYDTALCANRHSLSCLAELVGWDHVLFGSDLPFAPEPVAQLSIASLERDDRFDADELELVGRKNALVLLAETARPA
jgi:predicted TIM-barrel fold metal-dependent hydrolase